MSERIGNILEELSLDEKVALLSGASQWQTYSVERLRVPAIKMTDGPNGARGSTFAGGPTSACFPVPIALAATWNVEVMEKVGEALAEEAKTKGAHMLLAPTVNIHRSPVNGRNFECYSEDPYLASRMAVAFIRGVQGQGVGATVKHFVCNDSEFERQTISSEVDLRTMREIYLPPFEAAVKEGRVWGVMAAYNRVNGTYASENPFLLTDILRGEWGFDGVAISDWYGTRSTAEAANAGLDLEMPGPTSWRGLRLSSAVKAGEASPEAIDEAVRRVLRTISRAGVVEGPEEQQERAVDLPGHRTLARQAAGEGIVLLKNVNAILPLDAGLLEKVAIIGPNAKTAQIMGGGSSRVNPHYAISPYEGVVEKLGPDGQVSYEIGCTNHKRLLPLDTSLVTPVEGSEAGGFLVEYFNSDNLAGKAIHRSVARSAEHVWLGKVVPGIESEAFSARFSGEFTPGDSGAHLFGLSSSGPSRLFVDGEQLIDNWTEQTQGDSFVGTGSSEITATAKLAGGETHTLTIEYSKQSAGPLGGVRLGHLPPMPVDTMERAVTLAARSDVALVFVGLNNEWESEGFDRPHMDLVGDQDMLVEKVIAANPNSVVVLQTGSPVAMPWLDKAAAVVQAWYPGQECGNAIADVLFGDTNPSGRLPQTFPRRLEDNPAYVNYPGESGSVRYGEGIFVGYRYYEKKKIGPLFPFGYGLSYTVFTYDDLQLSATEISGDETLTLSVQITNSGEREGQEVVQLYVRDVTASVSRPEKELKGYAKIKLKPGETRRVSLGIDKKSLAYWDESRQAWVAEAGRFEALVGSSSQGIRATVAFRLTDTEVFGGPGITASGPSLQDTIGELMKHPKAWAVIEKHLPGISGVPELSMALEFSLVQVAGFVPDLINEVTLEAIAAELSRLS
jgi:beta-glucosidase